MKRIITVLLIMAAMTACKATNGSQSAYTERETLETIFARKSVRSYTNQPVEAEKVELLLKAGMAAPSGMDVRPWELVVVNDRATLDLLCEALPYAKMLKEAQLAIIVCGDEKASHLWIEDCSAVTENILLAAEALGLGAVWTSAIDDVKREAITLLIGLPENIATLCVIPVGYPSGEQHAKDKWDETKVHYNKW